MRKSYTIALAALAILGQRSAHSFPMGPVIAEPATFQVPVIRVKINRHGEKKKKTSSAFEDR